MTITVSIAEAQRRLDELCDAAVRGEEVVIIDSDGSSSQLVALTDDQKAAYKAAAG